MNPILDTLLHPLQRPVRLEPCDAPLPVILLTLLGGLDVLLLLLVDDAVVRSVCILLGDVSLAFDVIARKQKSESQDTTERVGRTDYVSKACRRASDCFALAS